MKIYQGVKITKLNSEYFGFSLFLNAKNCQLKIALTESSSIFLNC